MPINKNFLNVDDKIGAKIKATVLSQALPYIKKFNGKILNIHPSLLPKFKGLNTHERVIQNKEKFSGCTVHYVSSKLDSGKIILQKKVKIFKKDTPESLASKVLVQEHLLYPKALNKIIANPWKKSLSRF